MTDKREQPVQNLSLAPNGGEMNAAREAAAFVEQALVFQQMIMLFESATKRIDTQLDIFKEEFRVKGMHIPIAAVQSRIKEPMSIAKKLRKAGLTLSMENIRTHLNDVAGVRVICPYLADIYTVRDLILSLEDVRLVKEKDYVKHPKENGYRSLHLIVDVAVPLSENVEAVRCEIQVRTISMDSWASLEHQLRYKSREMVDEDTAEELTQCAQALFAADRKMQEIAMRLGTFENVDESLESIRFFS